MERADQIKQIYNTVRVFLTSSDGDTVATHAKNLEISSNAFINWVSVFKGIIIEEEASANVQELLESKIAYYEEMKKNYDRLLSSLISENEANSLVKPEYDSIMASIETRYEHTEKLLEQLTKKCNQLELMFFSNVSPNEGRCPGGHQNMIPDAMKG